MTTFLAACATDPGPDVDLIGVALKATPRPALPADCRVWQKGGVAKGMRLDQAVIVLDSSLTAANLRVRRCAAWYDGQTDG